MEATKPPDSKIGYISAINGPIVKVKGIQDAELRNVVRVGRLGILGVIIRLDAEAIVVQTFEDTDGLRLHEEVQYFPRPLSMELGPGLLDKIFDGIQRPLDDIFSRDGAFIRRGVELPALDRSRKWQFVPMKEAGVEVQSGDRLGWVQETSLIKHYILVPPGIHGTLDSVRGEGKYSVEDTIATLRESGSKNLRDLQMFHYWPIRKPRPFFRRLLPDEPLVTGMRVVDLLFPIAKGGVFTVVGGFGTGKTVTQQNLAKWCDADIIVYIGCGERGNEMADVLEEFPQLLDPRSGKPLMERTILIGNTSNMPVSAREASIFSGLTMAEYYRDMGYHVTLLADSTSRWAEALREISGRLEEMPAEGGYPAYLASRLSSFYERAGYVQIMGKTHKVGSISITGAVSPPAGDFSEPVTKTTRRFVRGFWALDSKLAYSRHYPAISWVESYSFYPDYIRDWWHAIDDHWWEYRTRFKKIMAQSDELQNIVQLIGMDALPYEQQLTLFTADIIKRGFLTQNAFDEVDRYCSPEKILKMAKLIMFFHEEALHLLDAGIPLFKIKELSTVNHLLRMKSEIANEDLERFSALRKMLEEEIYELKHLFSGMV